MKITKQILAVVAALTAMAGTIQAGSVGVNFQSNPFGIGPYSVASFGSAYGTAAADWLEVGPQGGTPTTGGFNYTAPAFSSPAMNGGTMNASWSASGEYCAFGYCYANQPGGNNPTTGEEAVLSGTMFGTATPNTQGDIPIVVTLSGLKSFASSYTVTLIAAQDDGTGFQPAAISDGTTQETINFVNTTQGGLYNTTRMSPMDVESSVNTYSGDTLTVTITGEDGPAGTPRIRNALAGVVINFTSGSAAPVISISQNGGNVILTWAGGGTLQSASEAAGPYSAVGGATSPYSTAASGDRQFFRVVQ